MKKLWLLILLVLFLTGCGTTGKTVYQIKGYPVPDKVIEARIFGLGAIATYDLTKSFMVKEGDESYKSFEHLSLFEGIHKLKKDETVEMKLSVFNPIRSHYKIIQHVSIEGGESEDALIYEGDLSRNSVEFQLPVVKHKLVIFYYDVLNEKDSLVYQSFKAQYIIEG